RPQPPATGLLGSGLYCSLDPFFAALSWHPIPRGAKAGRDALEHSRGLSAVIAFGWRATPLTLLTEQHCSTWPEHGASWRNRLQRSVVSLSLSLFKVE